MIEFIVVTWLAYNQVGPVQVMLLLLLLVRCAAGQVSVVGRILIGLIVGVE